MPTPGDPRIANLVVLAVCILLGWLASLAAARHLAPGAATAPRDRWLIYGFGAFVVLALMANALWAGSRRAVWERLAALPPLGTAAGISAAANGRPVAVTGRVSTRNKVVRDRHVVYWDEGGWQGPLDLVVDVEGGEARVTRVAEAHPWGWSRTRGRTWLDLGEPVVVLGTARHGTSAMEATRGGRVVSVEAGILYSGTHASFVSGARQESRRIWPLVLAWGSAAAAVGIVVLLVAARLRPAGPAAGCS